jgi:hypothetical protein
VVKDEARLVRTLDFCCLCWKERRETAVVQEICWKELGGGGVVFQIEKYERDEEFFGAGGGRKQKRWFRNFTVSHFILFSPFSPQIGVI